MSPCMVLSLRSDCPWSCAASIAVAACPPSRVNSSWSSGVKRSFWTSSSNSAIAPIGLFPTQTFLDQRADTREAQERLDVLRAQNESFEDRIERLETNAEIERLAREQYNLVYPGEEAYAVLPVPLPPLSLPEIWPFGPLLDRSVTTDEVDDQLDTP